ncbi:MAG: hypothetical protein KCHDKBKB_00088 [Elusimicrobia bacterium]|nr:hypothetical protein [Elusimicrobiota bacterium]
MDIPQKLQVIQKRLGLTQTKLADKFGVSFVAFNSWWRGKSNPRPKALAAINELYLEVTGQKIIPTAELVVKKQALFERSAQYKNVIEEILKNRDIKDQYILKLTYNSNSIEGSTLTEPDTAAILFDNVALPDKSLTEQLEAKNHQTALNYLFDHLLSGKTINEDLILKLHGILMNSIRPDAGSYRRHAVRITGIHLPTANYLKVPILMSELMSKAEERNSDIIATSSVVQSRFEQIHPFSDGNGRVGRLIMNAMLLKANLAPAIIKQQQKQLYYTYLYKAQTAGDHSQLENFLCNAVIDGLKILERKDLETS